ncbi:hypothetical protein LguiA_013678 [Lonicera macranthoides]
MKRIASTDSLGAMISMCPNTDEGSCHVYGRDFQSMLEGLDEEGCVEELGGQMGEKKRRLRVEQVKALEKNFEVENKLEPERKVKLANELGLQPRQVAVWFQNRRARWKTKQLERDYGVLKANYDALKVNFERLQQDNEAMQKEIRELKSKLHDEEEEEEEEEEENNQINNVSVKEEAMVLDNNDNLINQTKFATNEDTELNYESFNSNNGELLRMGTTASRFFSDLKDGSSDSDSSAIFNEDNNNNSPNSSSTRALQSHRLISPVAAVYQPQFVKIEEHNFFGGDEDETCNFFSDDQAPALPWYCQEQWS